MCARSAGVRGGLWVKRAMRDPKRRFIGVEVTDESDQRRKIPYCVSKRLFDGTTAGEWLHEDERRHSAGAVRWLAGAFIGFLVALLLTALLLKVAASSSSALIALSPIALPFVALGVGLFGMARAGSIGGAIGQARCRLAHGLCPSCNARLPETAPDVAVCEECGGVWRLRSGDDD